MGTSETLLCPVCGDEVAFGDQCLSCGALGSKGRGTQADAAFDERLLFRVEEALSAQAELARRIAAQRGEAAVELSRDARILTDRIRRQVALLRARLAERRELIPALEESLGRAQDALEGTVFPGSPGAEPPGGAAHVLGRAAPATVAHGAGHDPTHAAPSNRAQADREDAAPVSIRRAMAYIEQHPREPIRIGDIANAAGVSPRALQYGFRRHLGIRPMAYLRLVRLEHAHRALQSADDDHGESITEIAKRWGFGNASRFVAAYQEAYGIRPGRGRPLSDDEPDPVRSRGIDRESR